MKTISARTPNETAADARRRRRVESTRYPLETNSSNEIRGSLQYVLGSRPGVHEVYLPHTHTHISKRSQNKHTLAAYVCVHWRVVGKSHPSLDPKVVLMRINNVWWWRTYTRTPKAYIPGRDDCHTHTNTETHWTANMIRNNLHRVFPLTRRSLYSYIWYQEEWPNADDLWYFCICSRTGFYGTTWTDPIGRLLLAHK